MDETYKRCAPESAAGIPSPYEPRVGPCTWNPPAAPLRWLRPDSQRTARTATRSAGGRSSPDTCPAYVAGASVGTVPSRVGRAGPSPSCRLTTHRGCAVHPTHDGARRPDRVPGGRLFASAPLAPPVPAASGRRGTRQRRTRAAAPARPASASRGWCPRTRGASCAPCGRGRALNKYAQPTAYCCCAAWLPSRPNRLPLPTP